MGDEAACTARFGGKAAKGRALLEPDRIVFRSTARGELRLSIPLSTVRSAEAKDGDLILSVPEGVARLAVGAARAAKWAERIRNPRSVIDKLGVKADSRVALLGVDDESFLGPLRARAHDVTRGKPRASTDLVFVRVESRRELDRLRALVPALKPNGAIWVVHPKGRPEAIRDVDVIGAAKKAGLVDNKVVGFSPTHSALRLVIPLAKRADR